MHIAQNTAITIRLSSEQNKTKCEKTESTQPLKKTIHATNSTEQKDKSRKLQQPGMNRYISKNHQ